MARCGRFFLISSFAVRQRISLPCSLYRNLTDSPELPDWFRHPHDQHNYVDADDFVLQTKLEFLEASDSKRKTTDSRLDYGKEPCNIDDNDVDKICKVLRLNFTSFEDLFQAFVGCNVEISEALINMILKRFSNDWFPAFGFFRWAGARANFKHSSISYDMMVDILGKSKQFDVMWSLINEMVCLGGLVSLTTMTKVMRRLAGAGRWGDAIKIFKSIESFGVRKDTIAINALLDTLCKEKSVKHARDAFLELRDEVQPNASSFNILIHGWSKARKIEEAIRMIEEMREFGYTPCVITFTSLIEGYCLEKNFRMACAILNEMRGHGCQPNVVTYTIIMHSLAKAKEIQEALLVFEMMKDDGCAPDTSFYNSLIFLMAKSGKLRDAHHIFEQMSKNDILPDVTTFNTLISASCDYSEAENALKLVFSMQEFDCKPDIKTYTPLLKLCCKWKWVRVLLYLLGHMFKKDISLDSSAYNLLVLGLCRNGKIEQSCLFFEKMVMTGFTPKQSTYCILIKELERKNMDRVKLKIQQCMLQVGTMKLGDFQQLYKHHNE
ncbi:pentatricopeptide repeat-containing protein At3g22670, mitochondrial-like [Zingiber officinale]|nr:pentatricopeptide repeat-containing protein At3g22670, mitochondrial-like [Zingiber officinale]XP_042376765.1 pentatricopeptide repeat-containing protein At3g22670, mitochondrial-like [Zingiber officinale]XP_042376766.1 pentatricopeptide repeat-containing protein At3g22670, mitochondrial-like [Zingiber officinale]XP_042376768.1 pentatricopeptide repeat-containing protein At3g22670, mitochondrial-like [Zingiber officinale]XP_042376769.1 pentatricopeptide repeat-containing protein At3g22670, m